MISNMSFEQSRQQVKECFSTKWHEYSVLEYSITRTWSWGEKAIKYQRRQKTVIDFWQDVFARTWMIIFIKKKNERLWKSIQISKNYIIERELCSNWHFVGGWKFFNTADLALSSFKAKFVSFERANLIDRLSPRFFDVNNKWLLWSVVWNLDIQKCFLSIRQIWISCDDNLHQGATQCQ